MGSLRTSVNDLLPIDDEASVSDARRRVRDQGRAIGLTMPRVEEAAIVVSELAHNQLRYGRLGEIGVRTFERGGHPGLEILATDSGSGLADPLGAFRGTPGAGPGLGMGLAGVRRLAREVDVVTRAREGLTITARILPDEAPRRPEVSIVGRPHPDEHQSGDDALVVRTNEHIVVALADGLGHGPNARLASSRAMRCVAERADLSPIDILAECDVLLRGTRGTALAVARVDLADDTVTISVAGNIRAGLFDSDGGQRFGFAPRVLGTGRGRRLREETVARRGRALVLFSDGLPERTDPSLDQAGVRGWPHALAARLLARHARDTDDATVLALR